MAWNLCDEPLGEAIKGSAKNAAVHQQVAKELDLKFSIFTGATSMKGSDPKNPHYPLVRALGMPSLNDHDEASIQLIRDAGHRFSFYNDGNRWTFGRYMKALVVRYGLAYRATWHFNVAAGDPYYALDCREDDYCWYNTDAEGTMIPNLSLLSQIQPGLNDYRYLTTLERLVKEKRDLPVAVAAKKVYEEQIGLVAGKDQRRRERRSLTRIGRRWWGRYSCWSRRSDRRATVLYEHFFHRVAEIAENAWRRCRDQRPAPASAHISRIVEAKGYLLRWRN